MKFRAEWFAAAAVLLPIGVAVAEVAGDSEAEAVAPSQFQNLLQSADKVARSVVAARKQLTTAADAAGKDEDLLLRTCLLDKLTTVKRLEGKLSESLGELQRASDEANAQRPFVIVTVIGQKVALTMEEAASCVDSKNQEGAVSVELIEPPSDVETDFDYGTDTNGNAPAVVDDFVLLPPPTGVATETDFDPSTDMEPPVASPTR